MSLTRGLRIALTRNAEGNEAWAAALGAREIESLQIECLVSRPLPLQGPALQAAVEFSEALIFSSPRAVLALREITPDLSLADKPCACVGEASAQAARELGAQVLFIAPEQTARSLGEEWIRRQPAQLRTLWLTASEARPDLEEVFRSAGRRLTRLAIYSTQPADGCDASLAQTADAIFFASPSAAAAMAAEDPIPSEPRLISIGPSTTLALEKLGCTVSGEASERTLEGLLQALEACLRREQLSH